MGQLSGMIVKYANCPGGTAQNIAPCAGQRILPAVSGDAMNLAKWSEGNAALGGSKSRRLSQIGFFTGAAIVIVLGGLWITTARSNLLTLHANQLRVSELTGQIRHL